MFLAQCFDAADGGGPYLSAARARVTQPELLSRLIGYLDTAPRPAPGLHTDGVWVWPDALVEQARERGAAPQRQFLEHIQQALFLLPDIVAASALATAVEVAGRPPNPEPPAPPYRYLVGPHRTLARVGAGDAWSRFDRHGWDRDGGTGRSGYSEVSGRDAAAVLDEQWATFHAANVAAERETEPVHDGLRNAASGDVAGLRVARLFDGESPDGRPWFSPGRLRIPEPQRRERLGAYLAAGTAVLRSTGRLVDPLGSGDPLVPLGFRTDGQWVWPEAAAYYVRTRGLAPELDLLRHIEERGYRLPAPVPADLAVRAAAAAQVGARPAPPRVPVTYYYSDEYEFLVRARGGPEPAVDLLTMDLLWTVTDLLDRFPRMGPYSPQLEQIPESTAIQIADRCLAETDEPVPPGWRTLAE
jgi:hypothetical protein